MITSDQFNTLIKVLIDLLGKLSSQYTEAITFTSGRYDKPEGFFLYVGTAGNVVFEDMRGVQTTRNMITGYHPVKIRAVIQSGTTASDLGACFN